VTARRQFVALLGGIQGNWRSGVAWFWKSLSYSRLQFFVARRAPPRSR
jgi:hypothetical protein